MCLIYPALSHLFCSHSLNGKGQAAQRQPLRYLSLALFVDHPHHIHTLSIKLRRNLESVIPLAVVRVAVHAAQCRLNEKTAKSEDERAAEREICALLSVEVIVELAPGPPHPSEVG